MIIDFLFYIFHHVYKNILLENEILYKNLNARLDYFYQQSARI